MELLVFIVIGGVIGLIIRALMNAGKSNVPKELMYNCNQTVLIAAIKKTAERINYTIESVDTISGRIRLGIGMSMTSFTTNGNNTRKDKTNYFLQSQEWS